MTPAPLPIDDRLQEIRAAVDRHRAAVIVAAPGAGKTTRIPPALLGAGPAIVLQPRRAAARAIAARIAHEQKWTVGQEVGWHVRMERHFSAQTKLVIATEGILTSRLQNDPFLSNFATIILDEFHERSIHADLAIAMAKQALIARNDLRLVVMSATMDAERVSTYLGGCPVIEVLGHTHPVSVEYTPGLNSTTAACLAIKSGEGGVLCFEPGAAEISQTVSTLRRTLPPHIVVLPLHGGLPGSEQDAVLKASSTQRVIVATNIAETSLTVPGITAVVDTDFEKVARYDPNRGVDSLPSNEYQMHPPASGPVAPVASGQATSGDSGRSTTGSRRTERPTSTESTSPGSRSTYWHGAGTHKPSTGSRRLDPMTCSTPWHSSNYWARLHPRESRSSATKWPAFRSPRGSPAWPWLETDTRRSGRRSPSWPRTSAQPLQATARALTSCHGSTVGIGRPSEFVDRQPTLSEH